MQTFSVRFTVCAKSAKDMELRRIIMQKITKDTLIIDLVQANPNAAEILFAHGMHCLGCAMAHGETIEQATNAHGEDLEQLLAELNAQ